MNILIVGASRGLASSLREYLREEKIAVSIISPGGIATDVPFELGPEAALARHKSNRIPVGDIVAIIKTLIHLSHASVIKEIVVSAMSDTEA
jgi:NAD(P)-dependent dehydrogenase (short-subunit alcohol dehydrogenase family)